MSTEKQLVNKRVAILATNGVEQSELTQPRDAIREAGGEAYVVSLDAGQIQGMNSDAVGDKITVDRIVGETKAEEYDALVLPGGLKSPDTLRQCCDSVKFVRDFFEQGKPVASICHGPWLLAEAGVLDGRKVTSYPSIRTDLENAGANWVDEECVCDEGLVTSRSPQDLKAFCDKLVEEIAEGKHAAQTA